jgi:cytochrome o ubiquinol oxidase subunit 2
MHRRYKLLPWLFLGLVIIIAAGFYLQSHTIAVLQPAGEVGTKERGLIIFASALALVVVIPVFTLLGTIAWKYRESNTKPQKYTPDADGSKLLESIWWIIPTILIGIISYVTWHSSYQLDPYRQLVSQQKTMKIQVVSLDWKWLFIYPDQKVASVNYVYVPTGTPVDFEITSDTVMTSFWVPQLGGQMYAMPGMTTHLNLMANKGGRYHGLAANISGKGFADQTFTVAAIKPELYSKTVSSMRASTTRLDSLSYTALAQPNVLSSPRYYGSIDSSLFDTVIMKYMMPMSSSTVPNPSPTTRTDADPHYLNLQGTEM